MAGPRGVEPGPAGAQDGFSGREARGEPLALGGSGPELCAGCGTARLAHADPHEVPADAGSGAARLQSQLESVLEECQIKLSSLVSDLLGASGRRILRALAEGETDPARLAALGDKRLRASQADLLDALSGPASPLHRQVLALYLAWLELVEAQMGTLEQLIAEAMQAHSEAIARLAELPGLGVDSAQQILAEIGPQAAAFPSAGQLASWVGVCPGSHESAGESVC